MLERVFYHNTLLSCLIAAGIAAGALLALSVLRRVAANRFAALAKRTEGGLDDLVCALLAGIHLPVIAVLALYAGSLVLALPEPARRFVEQVAILALLVQAAISGRHAIAFAVDAYARRKAGADPGLVTTMRTLAFLANVVLFALLALAALDNLGIDVTALVAGLGIGGIAVALAIQNILGDLFASLSIVLDRPFQAGDFIVVDGHMGTVEHIGLKTTRLRSLTGEQIVISNGDLLRSRIRNYKRMQKRRVAFDLRIAHNTPPEKLAAVAGILRGAIESQPGPRVDAAALKEIGVFSVVFEAAYILPTPEPAVFRDVHEKILIELLRRLAAEGIPLARPPGLALPAPA